MIWPGRASSWSGSRDKVQNKFLQHESNDRFSTVTVYKSQLLAPTGTAKSIVIDGIQPSSEDSSSAPAVNAPGWKRMNEMLAGVDLPTFRVEVECGGGFYVRSLIDDLGKDCDSCAHMTELLR